MKFLHLADLHLGKRLNDFDLMADQRHVLEQALALARTEAVDAVVLAGDIYDKSIPSAGAVNLLDDFLTALCEAGCPVLVVSGNHDSADRLDYGRTLFARQNVHIAGRYEGQMTPVRLDDEHGAVEFWLLPFLRPGVAAYYLKDADCSDYTAAVRAALAGCRRDPAARQVLVAHQFVTAAGQAPGLSGSESVMVGGLDNVDAAAFEGFDYVALGHIHRRQPVGANAWYSGTPMAYALDEAGQEKGCLLVTLDAAGHAETRFVPFAPLHPIRHVTGPLAELIAEAAAAPEGREDYIYATLTDPTPVTDAMARLQAVWPNAMKLDYPNTAAAADLRTAAAEVETKSFQELFFDFYRQMNGQDPSEEAWQIVRRLTSEGGDEA